MNLIIPIILIIISVGAFITFIDPKYKEIKELQGIKNEFVDKQQKTEHIRNAQRKLIKQSGEIKEEDLLKLKKILPGHMDNIKLIVDMQRIIKENALSIDISDFALSEVKGKDGSKIEVVDKEYESVDLSFSFVSNYINFKRFMVKIRESLRILDVSSIKLEKEKARSGNETNNFKFSVTVTAYWLKNK